MRPLNLQKTVRRAAGYILLAALAAVLWMPSTAALAKDYAIPFDLIQKNYKHIKEPAGDFTLKYKVPDEYVEAFEKEGHEAGVRKKVEKYLTGRRKEIHRFMDIYEKQLKGLENGWSRQNILVPKKKRLAQIKSVMADFNKDYRRIRSDIQEKLEKRLQKEFARINKNSEAIDDNVSIGEPKAEMDNENFDVDDDFEKSILKKKEKKETDDEAESGDKSNTEAEAARKYHASVVAVKKVLTGLGKETEDIAGARGKLNDAIEVMRKSPAADFKKNAGKLKDPIADFGREIKQFEGRLADVRKAADQSLEIIQAAGSKKAKTRKKIALAKTRVEKTLASLKQFNRLLNEGKALIGTARSFMKADNEAKIKKSAMGLVKKGRTWQAAMAEANKSVQGELASYK
ncbi:MAG: hypothetical protein JEZ11_15060 [Desulfobacterales bacterium]|nr:hypothetical protein [Desulfobacterales bacterium]